MNPDKGTLDELRIDRSTAPRPKAAGWLVLALLVLILCGGGGWWWFTRPGKVEVRTAVAREISSGGQRTLLNASGYVTARRAATVSSKVTGKVVEVLIEEGMKVQAGQLLARLDASNLKANLELGIAQLKASRSRLDETRVRLEDAEKELRRVTNLVSDEIAAQAELDRAEAEAKSLKARLDQQATEVTVAEKQVALWEQQLADTEIRAPFSGIVVSKNAQPGEMISPVSAGGGFTRTGICTIVDMSSLEIEVDVNESYINRVEEDQPVEATLDSYSDWRIPAKVIAIIPTADRQKATVKVRVGFDELDPRILPDMGVKVAFQSADTTESVAAKTIQIPKAALREQDGRTIVWVVQDDQVERRAVTVGATFADQVSIAAGLATGASVVIEGPSSLQDGDRVIEMKK